MGEFDDDGDGGDWDWENESASTSTAPATINSTPSTNPPPPLQPPTTAILAAVVQPTAVLAVRDEVVVEEDGIVDEVEDEEYEMDHDEPSLTPALLSPAASLPASTTSASSPLPSTPPVSAYSILEERREVEERVTVQRSGVEDDYDMDAGQPELGKEEASPAAAWRREAAMEAAGNSAEEADHVLPPAASLSLHATDDFAIHKHHRSVSLNSNDHIDHAVDEQPTLSSQLAFAVQSESSTSLLSLTALPVPSISATPPCFPSLPAAVDSGMRVSLNNTETGTVVEADDRTQHVVRERKQTPSEYDSKLEALSLSAIEPSAAGEEVIDDGSGSAALADLDADFDRPSVPVSPSAAVIPSVATQEEEPAVVVEDEPEEEESMDDDEMEQARQSSLSTAAASSALASIADRRLSRSARPSTVIAAHEPKTQQPSAHVQLATAKAQASNDTTRSEPDTRIRHTANKSAPSLTNAVPPSRQQGPLQQAAMRQRPVSPQPTRAAVHRGPARSIPAAYQSSAFPFSSPSHAFSSQYVFSSALPRLSHFVPSVLPSSAHKLPVAQPTPPPSLPLPAPIAPSAPYVASKQALLQMIVRHQHHRTRRQQDKQQQQQEQAALNRSSPFGAAASYYDTLGGNDTQPGQLQRDEGERLARMLKVWQLRGQGGESTVISKRRQQEEKEDMEMEWLARQEEQRRQEERHWQRRNARRPATPAAPLHVQQAWRDEDGASEADSDKGAEQSASSMVQLMESLRVSARHEIAMQEAARRGLR